MEDTIINGIANILSTLTILSCIFLKVPQILYIREKKSAEGIYVQAMLMEITGFSITTLYNFTSGYGFMTYLEYPIILLQVYVMLYYVLLYKGMLHQPVVSIVTITYWLLVAGFVAEALPKAILSYLIPFCTPLSGFAKVTYIYGIIRAGNADAVSLTTWIISVATNLARIFTVYVDSADTKLLINFLVSTMLSSGVLVTALYYQLYASPVTSKVPPRKSSGRRHSHAD